MKTKYLWLIFLAINPLFGIYENIVTVSMVKNGSSLLAKCCSLIADKPIAHLHTKWRDQKRVNDYISNNYKVLMAIRDPRDRVVSFIIQADIPKIIPMDQAITLMVGNYEKFFRTCLVHGTEYIMLSDKYKDSCFDWIDNYPPHLFYLSKFEKLVGPKGGGSEKEQVAEVLNIAAFMEVDLSFDEAQAIARKLFGGTQSFRQGTFGHWKEHFTEQQKQLFKADMGNYLIRLGYEE